MDPRSSKRERIQFDRYQRLSAVAEVVARLAADGPVLDVGGAPGELASFLPGSRVVVTDLPGREGATVVARGQELPFAAAAFPVVVCVDVLEHVAPGQRGSLMAELFRVASRYVVVAVPRGSPDVEEAEGVVDLYYRALHGQPHPWLVEHRRWGLPTPQEVGALLEGCGARFVRIPNGFLPRWVLGMLVNRYLESLPQAEARLAKFNERYNTAYAAQDQATPSYRDVYVATRGDYPLPPVHPAEGRKEFSHLCSALLATWEGADLELSDSSVAAVIVTYNHQAEVAGCVEALRQSQGVRPSIVVVDNGSTDESAKVALGAGAVVIRLGRNRGFAAAFNVGWRSTRAQVVVSVNPDVRVMPDALEELVQACGEFRQVGIVGATLLDEEGRILHAGAEILPNYCTVHRLRGQTRVPASWSPAPYVTGALMAVKRPVLEALGGLDERFFPAYYEETDLCTRAWRAGWQVVYWPWATGVHRESSTLGDQTMEFFRAYHTNRLRFVAAHLPLAGLPSFLRAERRFRRGRPRHDVEMRALRATWKGWWWRVPLAVALRPMRSVFSCPRWS